MTLAAPPRRSAAVSILPASSAALSFALVSLFCLLSPARADDLTFGGDSRLFAMGGAGIALMPTSESGVRANPATLALARGSFSIDSPSAGARANHISLSKAANYLFSGTSTAGATTLAQDFASQDSDFGVVAGASLRVGRLEIGASGVGIGRIEPNASLQTWAHTGGGNVNAIPYDARSNIYGGMIYDLPDVSYALSVPQPRGAGYDVAMGVRLKDMNAVYTHYVANVDSLRGLLTAQPAPEMRGSRTLTQTGFGLDYGLMLRQRNGGPFSAALVASNVICPNFRFVGTDRDGSRKVYTLAVSTLSAGMGYQRRGTTIAVDAVDLGKAVASTELRAGLEQRFGLLALRGGYASATGFTAGIGIAGFSIAYAARQPLEITRTLRF